MAAILKLRRGSTTPTLVESEIFFNTTSKTLIVGDGSTNHTLVKIGSNTGNVTLLGNLSVSGTTILTTITGSNLYITNNVLIDGNIHIGGHITLGSGSDGDIINVNASLSGSLIPDSDNLYDLGSDNTKYRHLYAVSASIDELVVGGSGILSSSITNFVDYSSSVDSRIDNLNSYTQSTDSRLDSLELTGSDHESRIDEIETTFSSSVDLRLNDLQFFSSSEYQVDSSSFDLRLDNINLYTQSTDLRLDDLELTGSDHESRLDTIETTFSSSVDERLDLLENFSSSEYQTDSSSFDNRIQNLTIVTGSYVTTGSNTFNGDQTITGSLKSSGSVEFQGLPWPTTGFESHFLLTQPYSHNGRSYEGAAIGLELTSSFGTVYQNSILIHNYDNHVNPDYGTEVNVGSDRVHIMAMASGSNNLANVSVEDVGDETTRTLIYGDDIQIGLFTGDNIQIGNNSSVNMIRGSRTYFVGDIDSIYNISASFFVGDGSQLTNIPYTNIVFDGGGILSSSVQDFDTFSGSVDSRLDQIEGPLSTSIDQQLTSIHSYTSSLKGAIDINGSNLTVLGDLRVEGTTTTINTSELLIEDTLLAIASGSTTSAESNGAGFFISGANASILWNHSEQSLEFNTKVSSSVGFKGDGSELTGLTADFVEYVDVLNKPALVSGSSQIDLTSTTNYESGILLRVNAIGLFSQSAQVNADSITNFDQNVKDKINIDLVHSGSFLGTATTSDLDEGTKLYHTTERVQSIIDSNGLISGSEQLEGIFLEINGDGVVSGSSQISADETQGWSDDVKTQLNFNNVISGSSQVSYPDLSDIPSGIISGSSQVSFNEITDKPTLVSGSSQVDVNDTQNFTPFSSSVDSRLDLLETDQHTHSNKSNLDTINQNLSTTNSVTFDSITLTNLTEDTTTLLQGVLYSSSGELVYSSFGDSIYYHVSQSITNGDTDVIGTAGAVKNYIDEQLLIIGAGDITSVIAGDGISGGADSGPATLTLDTGSQHFIDGVTGIAPTLPDGLVSGSTQVITLLNGSGILSSSIETFEEFSSSVDLRFSGLSTDYNDLENIPSGIVSSSAQISGYNTFLEITGDSVVSGSSQIDVTQTQNFTSFSSSVDSRLDSQESFSSSIDTTIKTKMNLDGVISGSSQIIGGSGILSSSVQDFDTFSSSVDLRLDSQESFSSSIDSTIKTKLNTEAVISGSSQVDLTQTNSYVTGIKTRLNAEGVISGSAQIFLGSNVVSSSQQISNYGIFAELNGDNLVSSSAQVDALGFLQVNGDSVVSSSAQISAYNTFLEINGDSVVSSSAQVKSLLPSGVISGSEQLTGSLVDLVSDQTISGTKTFNDIVVNGTGSFAYITSVSGDAKIIGDAFIILNTNTPTSRYAGLSVYDSGSTLSTASFYFDGQTNNWGYEYSSSLGVDYAVTIFGPEYTTKGNPQYLTSNRIPKAVDNHHLNDSNISDDGTLITLGSNVQVNGNISLSGTVDGIDLQNFSSSVDGRLDTLEGTSNENPLTFNDTSTIDFTRVGDTITAKAIGGIISGSSQVNADTVTNFDSNVKDKLNVETVISGSSQVSMGGDLSGTANNAQIIAGAITNTEVNATAGIVYTKLNLGGSGIVSGSAGVTLAGDVTGAANSNTVGKIQGVAITSGEATQLANIDTTTISATQWGYLGSSNQGIATTDSPSFLRLTSTQTTGTAPFTVASTTVVTNLNADLLDGVQGASYARSDANDTLSGIITFSNSTASTSKTTGAIVVTGGIGTSGDVFAGGDVVAYASSDRRLKDEITPIENSLHKINSIGGYSFVWNAKQDIYKGKDYGVIAQEIEEILPELVETRESGYKAVKYDRIVSLLIEGIKELSKEVSELKEKIGK